MLWGGRNTANKYHWHMWGLLCTVWTTLGLPQLRAGCDFHVYTAQAPDCSARVLSKVGPAFGAFPRSRLLRSSSALPDGFCVLFPSQVQAIQATGCLVSALCQVGCVSDAHPWSQPLGFLGVPQRHSPMCAVCLLWRADLRL